MLWYDDIESGRKPRKLLKGRWGEQEVNQFSLQHAYMQVARVELGSLFDSKPMFLPVSHEAYWILNDEFMTVLIAHLLPPFSTAQSCLSL